MNNLKPCPFCGATEENELILHPVPPAHYQIKCSFCGIHMKHDRKDKVISFWNTRDENAHKIDL